ncbi:MAG: sigma-70 family RNA polymerase sigma factor [Bacteroidota bacterium]
MSAHRTQQETAIDPDFEIIIDLQHGRNRRFRELVDRYKDRALTLAMKIVRDRREAEEVVQDAFVKVYRNVDQFRGESSFHTWFYRILYNESISRLRRNRNIPIMVNAEDNEESGLFDHDALTDARILSSDLQRVIEEEFERLADHYRTALTLFYLQELHYEEIASVMNVPVGTVKSYIFRGKQLLRRRLGTYDHLEAGVA